MVPVEPTRQERILREVSKLPDGRCFYLTGGTALAEFYLGHRLSFDLDLFTAEQGLPRPFSYALEQHLQQQNLRVQVLRRLETFVDFIVTDGRQRTRLQLALDSPFRFAPPERSSLGILVNDYVDLVVDKLLAFYGRCEPRDAVDLFFILQREELDELLSLAARKDPGFDLYWFARALIRATRFPPQLERWPVVLRKPLALPTLRRCFQQIALELMQRVERLDGPQSPQES